MAVALPKLVYVTMPLTVVPAMALAGKLATALMSDTKGTLKAAALLLPGFGSAMVLVPAAMNTTFVVPTGTLMAVV